MIGRAFDAPNDAEAVVQAKAVFLVNTAEDARITAYRLRNPMPGSDRIFHTEYVSGRYRRPARHGESKQPNNERAYQNVLRGK